MQAFSVLSVMLLESLPMLSSPSSSSPDSPLNASVDALLPDSTLPDAAFPGPDDGALSEPDAAPETNAESSSVAHKSEATIEAAVALFNQRQFFECHEVLEKLWHPLPKGPEKWFLQGLLQVGVGFHHLEQETYTGAKNLFTAGVEKLEVTMTNRKGFVSPMDLAPFLLSTHAALETVLVLGPDCLGEFPDALIPQIQMR